MSYLRTENHEDGQIVALESAWIALSSWKPKEMSRRRRLSTIGHFVVVRSGLEYWGWAWTRSIRSAGLPNAVDGAAHRRRRRKTIACATEQWGRNQNQPTVSRQDAKAQRAQGIPLRLRGFA